MNIAVLTSSRADFGIYLPLLKLLKKDPFFDVKIIAFGMHLSSFHGNTIHEIQETGFEKIDTIKSILITDDVGSISTSYGLTALEFSNYWANNHFDLVLCLGDRYEMSAAVQAGIPYGVKFAHFHGGETTAGAIDDIYRHQITIASAIHFTSTEIYKKRVESLKNSSRFVYNVGSMSLNELNDNSFIEESNFREEYEIPVEEDFILVTFHPATVNPHQNKSFAIEIQKSLKELCREYFVVVTMPNMDTNGIIFRDALLELKNKHPERFKLVDSFGKENYFNAMRYASFLIGNSSSGIIEAASFGKYVVNVGDRQKGRAKSENIIDCSFDANSILTAGNKAKSLGKYEGENIYKKENTAQQVMEILKSEVI